MALQGNEVAFLCVDRTLSQYGAVLFPSSAKEKKTCDFPPLPVRLAWGNGISACLALGSCSVWRSDDDQYTGTIKYCLANRLQPRLSALFVVAGTAAGVAGALVAAVVAVAVATRRQGKSREPTEGERRETKKNRERWRVRGAENARTLVSKTSNGASGEFVLLEFVDGTARTE